MGKEQFTLLKKAIQEIDLIEDLHLLEQLIHSRSQELDSNRADDTGEFPDLDATNLKNLGSLISGKSWVEFEESEWN